MQLGNRITQHNFSQNPSVNIPRSKFDRSHTAKDTINFDYLTPIFVDEVLPGDTMNLSLNSFARLQTQLVPIMDNMYIDYMFFFVPNRLVWDNWEKFCGYQATPGASTDYLIPQVTKTGPIAVNSIYDHAGVPPQAVNMSVNALPFRAMNLIYNEWIRDQNLQTPLPVPKDDGPDPDTTYSLFKRGKRHDYITSCLPTPQKGPSMQIPLMNGATVTTNNQVVQMVTPYDGITRNLVNTSASDNHLGLSGANIGSGGQFITFAAQTGLKADIANFGGTINQFRQAYLMQELFELDNRGGTRYVELMQAHFGVSAPDFRLQRPEYLGGGRGTINSHAVPQTSATDTGSAQGNLAAFGTHIGKGIGFNHSFVEHGYVIGFACPRADITYQQGLNKLFSRRTRYDFYWPKLSELGEQPVYNREVYYTGAPLDDGLPFGYNERYSEYKYKQSEIRGSLRSTAADSLDYWHLAQDFGAAPLLNGGFITQSTPIERALAVTDQPHLIIDMFFNYKSSRPMLVYSAPASLGRF